jgi:hypothetical protein
MAQSQIHVAYAYERRNACYRARAYVGEHRKPMHSIVVSIGDNPEEAILECVGYIERLHIRDKVALPREIIRHGRVSGIILDHLSF